MSISLGASTLANQQRRRACGPTNQLSAEKFFEQNAAHLQQRNAELAQVVEARRPQRGDERAGYIMPKRGVQASGGRHHERQRGVLAAPGGIVRPAGEGDDVVLDRTRQQCSHETSTNDAAAGLRKSTRQRTLALRPRPSAATRLIPYLFGVGHNDADLATSSETNAGTAGLDVLHKQKALKVRGWKMVVGGDCQHQRWVSGTRPLKTITGLNAAYEEAVSNDAPAAAPTVQMIQVRQTFGVRRLGCPAHTTAISPQSPDASLDRACGWVISRHRALSPTNEGSDSTPRDILRGTSIRVLLKSSRRARSPMDENPTVSKTAPSVAQVPLGYVAQARQTMPVFMDFAPNDVGDIVGDVQQDQGENMVATVTGATAQDLTQVSGDTARDSLAHGTGNAHAHGMAHNPSAVPAHVRVVPQNTWNDMNMMLKFGEAGLAGGRQSEASRPARARRQVRSAITEDPTWRYNRGSHSHGGTAEDPTSSNFHATMPAASMHVNFTSIASVLARGPQPSPVGSKEDCKQDEETAEEREWPDNQQGKNLQTDTEGCDQATAHESYKVNIPVAAHFISPSSLRSSRERADSFGSLRGGSIKVNPALLHLIY